MNRFLPLRLKGRISFLLDKRALLAISLAAACSVALFVLSMGVGEMPLSPSEVVKVLLGSGTELHALVVKSFRLPRILMAFLVGASLAVAGAILQGLIRNPLASPDVIGITAGGAAAAVTFLAVYTDPVDNALAVSIHWLPLCAFLGASFITVLVYLLSWRNGVSPTRLVLVGIGISAAMQGLTTCMLVFGPLVMLSQANLWLTGSVYGSKWEDVWVLLPWAGVLLFLAFVLARHLNVHELGDELAAGVGSHVQKYRFLLLLISSALAGGAVAFAGGIGFVGLMAPHMARKLIGPSFGGLLPLSALIGGMLVLSADTLGRTLFSPIELPAGIFTAMVGAPYFIYLLYKNRNL